MHAGACALRSYFLTERISPDECVASQVPDFFPKKGAPLLPTLPRHMDPPIDDIQITEASQSEHRLLNPLNFADAPASRPYSS